MCVKNLNPTLCEVYLTSFHCSLFNNIFLVYWEVFDETLTDRASTELAQSSRNKTDGTLSDRATTKIAQPSRRMTRSMTEDPWLGQDHSIAIASKPLISQRITKSRAHIIGLEH